MVTRPFEASENPGAQEWDGGLGDGFELHDLMSVFFSMLGTLESLVLYSDYINELLDHAYEKSDDEALFKAIRVDVMAITSEKAAHRLAMAVARRDETFLNKLRLAMLGRAVGA